MAKAKAKKGEPTPFAFAASAAANLKARLDEESLEHLRIACEIWLQPPAEDTTAADLARLRLCAAALIQAVDALEGSTLQSVLWNGGRTPSAWATALDEKTAFAFAREAAMALRVGSEAMIKSCGEPPPRLGRPPSGDWQLAGWVAAICLRKGIVPSESEGPFSEVMTAAWHAVRKANLPTHAVRTMLAKIRAGGVTAFPVALGVSYWLHADASGKLNVIFGRWENIQGQVLRAGDERQMLLARLQEK